MKWTIEAIKILSVFFLALTFLGCEEEDTVLPAVEAGFTFTLDQNTGTVTFINTSTNANNFAWNFGDGTSSEEIEPTKIYTENGTFTVILTASNVSGASDTFEDEVVVAVPEPIMVPIDFDGTNVDYDAIVGDNIGFSIVTNPETGNGNTTNVGQMIAGGGQFQNIQFPLGTAVDFSGENKTIQLELFSSTEIAVLIKFEDGVDGARDVEVGATHTGSGWETLSFDFATDAVASFIEGDSQNGQALVPDGQYGEMVLFIGFNADPGVEGTFFVDNIAQTTTDGGGIATEPTMAATAPTQDAASVVSVFSNAYTNTGGTNPRAFGNDGGATFSEIQVAGNDVWSYADTNFVGLQNDTGFDLTGRTNFSMDIWVAEDVSFRTGLISFTDPVSREDVEVNLTGGQWNNIDVALADLVSSLGSEGPLPDDPTINQIIFDVLGDGVEASIFVDNVFFYTADGGGSSLVACDGGELINDLESSDDSIFSNFGGGVGTVIDNPDTSVNTSAKVGQYVKNSGELFGGITIALDNNIDLNNGVFSIDIYSQTVRQLLFKLEGLDVELTTPTSGTGWETIEYDFNGNMGAVTGITLIMDNGTAGDGSADWTIQFDNIRLCSNDSTGGGGSAVSPFCRTQIQAFAGDAGSDIFLSVFNVDAQTMRVEIESADSDPVDLLILPAGAWNPSNAGISLSPAEISPGVWAGEFFFPDGAPENVEFFIEWSKVSFPGNWRSTDPAGSLDTVPFTATCDTSGGGGSSSGCTGTEVAATALPLDFEGCETFLASANFGNGLTSELAANPSKTGINTSDFVLRIDKPASSEVFAGIQNTFPTNFDLTTTDTFKIKVYSTKANVNFRFELAVIPNDGSIGNPAPVVVNIPNANEWTKVEFTFVNLPASPTTYNHLVIKPDNNLVDSPLVGDGTYYIDDLILE